MSVLFILLCARVLDRHGFVYTLCTRVPLVSETNTTLAQPRETSIRCARESSLGRTDTATATSTFDDLFFGFVRKERALSSEQER
jgi:hypothetical protein